MFRSPVGRLLPVGRLMPVGRLLIVFLGSLPFWPAAFADDPLAAKTLIVYATNSADSVAVKDHYIQARYSQPFSANVCAITPPDPNAGTLNETDFVNSVKTPIRNCLNSAGKANILYIVLAYIRPFEIKLHRGFDIIYAMDSYLADIWDQYSTLDFNPFPTATHRYYADVQNQGNLYVPFIPFDTFRSQPRSLLLYSVWRLDGATPAIAMGLVDKATQTMNTATGAACIDRNRGDITAIPDVGLDAGDWDLHQAGVFLGQAGFPVTEDPNYAEFGTDPAPAKCPPDGSPVAFYSGWYSFDNYNGAGVFNWTPGAIGFHLDSLSAADPRGGTNWSANALLNGITVTSGAVSEPYLEGLPRPAGVYRNLLEGANVGDAFLRNTRWLKWMIVNIGDPLYRPFPAGGEAPFNPPQPLYSLTIAIRDILGGVSTIGTVTLAAVAPPGGTSVTLSSNAPSLVSVPPGVTVAAGVRSASFTIGTQPVTGPSSLTLTASAGAATLNNSMTLYPLLSSVGFSQSTVTAGQTITGTVFLTSSAPPGGITVGLSSSETTVATVPATVFIPAGLGRANFTINTSIVQSNKTATIQASYAGSMTSADLMAQPAIRIVDFSPSSTVSSGQFVAFEVALTLPAPPGGATVTLTSSNPSAAPLSVSSIFIPAGTTYGATGFTAGPGPATATIQASYGGDTKSIVLTVQ